MIAFLSISSQDRVARHSALAAGAIVQVHTTTTGHHHHQSPMLTRLPCLLSALVFCIPVNQSSLIEPYIFFHSSIRPTIHFVC